MDRPDARSLLRAALRRYGPELADEVIERIVYGGAFTRWMDSIARRRPRGLVAWFRRLRGRDELSREEIEAVEQYAREAVARMRGRAQG